jgi:hypothetical protein
MALFAAVNVFLKSSLSGDRLNIKFDVCHTNTNWTTSSFKYCTSTTFPSNTVHIGPACTFYSLTNYNVIPSTGESFHMTTYNATIIPIQSATLFPTTFETCCPLTHRTISTFNHIAYFQITGGIHTIKSDTHAINHAVFYN